KIYVTNTIAEWQQKKNTVNDRWLEVLQFFDSNNHPRDNILRFVEYSLCLTGTNSEVERIFSHINNIWTPDKSQLKVGTLESLILTKMNLEIPTCYDFYKTLLCNEKALMSIHSQKKYLFK